MKVKQIHVAHVVNNNFLTLEYVKLTYCIYSSFVLSYKYIQNKQTVVSITKIH